MSTQTAPQDYEAHNYNLDPASFDPDLYIAARDAMFAPVPEPVAMPTEEESALLMNPSVEPETPYAPVLSDTVDPVPAVEAAPEPAPQPEADADESNLFAEAQRLARIAEKQGKPISPDVALARAKTALGFEEPVEPEPEPVLPSLEEFELRAAELEQRRAKAKEDYDPDALDSIIEETKQLAAERAAAERAHESLQAKQRAAFESEWDASFREVSAIFPEFADEKSAAYKAMAEMQEKLEKLGDPQAVGPDGPRYIGMMTAKALGLVPGLSVPPDTKPAVTPATSSRPVAAASVIPARGPQPYGGPSASPQTSLDTLIQSAAWDDEAYFATKAALGLRS